MMKKLVLIFLIASFIISGCGRNEPDKYQLIEGKDGKIYRMNKKTGRMVVVKGNKILSIESIEDQIRRERLDKNLEEPKNWGEKRISGKKLKTELVTSWRDNKIYYKYTISPYESLEQLEALRKTNYTKYAQQTFAIQLLDKNSFLIKAINVYLKDTTTHVNDKGIPISVGINSSVELSKSDYEAISYCTNTWSLDNELIPDFKVKTKYLWNLDLDIDGKAFMNTLWGMSEEQVREANNCILEEADTFLRLFYPKVDDMQRYKKRLQRKMENVGEVKIRYIFFDNRLFEVSVTATGNDSTELDKYVMSILSKEYGKGKPRKKRDIDIKRIEWENEITSVDYWLMRQDKTNDYLAGFKLNYKPIYKAIEDIEVFEKKSDF